MGTIKTTNIEPIANNGTVTLGSSGDTITVPSGATLNVAGTITNSGTATGFGSDFTPNFLAYQSSNQALATTTETRVVLDTEVYDSDNAFTNTSGNYKFTVPSGEAGKYVFYYSVRRENFAGARFYANLKLTRSGSVSSIITAEANGGSDAYDNVTNFIVTDCNVGDTFHIIAYHSDSGSRSLQSGNSSTFFGGYKLI
jgi:hypothetical protein